MCICGVHSDFNFFFFLPSFLPCLLFLIFQDSVSLSNFSCPITYSVDQVMLEPKKSACLCYLSAGKKACVTIAWFQRFFFLKPVISVDDILSLLFLK